MIEFDKLLSIQTQVWLIFEVQYVYIRPSVCFNDFAFFMLSFEVIFNLYFIIFWEKEKKTCIGFALIEQGC